MPVNCNTTHYRATPSQPYVLPRAIIPMFTLRAPTNQTRPNQFIQEAYFSEAPCKKMFYFHSFTFICLFCFSLPQLKPKISKRSCASRKHRRNGWQLVPTRGDNIQKEAPSTIGVSKMNLYLLGDTIKDIPKKSQALWGYIGSSSY